jgi:monofunctional glycosyltransferase
MNKLEEFSTEAAKDCADFLLQFAEDEKLIVSALLAAEDHRGRRHRGVDWISIARALIKSSQSGRVQGLSTIEQQYVRTVFRRRGSVFKCKLSELYLVRKGARRISKRQYWLGYLWRAYFGTGLNGYRKVRFHFVGRGILTELGAAEIVSCLKYPKPRYPNNSWRKRHVRRVSYVLGRMLPPVSDMTYRPVAVMESSSGKMG